jgi:hypothetical protein
MLRALTPRQAMASNRKAFNRLEPGMLVSIYIDPDQKGILVNRYFLTHRRVTQTSWSLLPLDRERNLKIVGLRRGQKRKFVTKEFAEMMCLQIHGQD